MLIRSDGCVFRNYTHLVLVVAALACAVFYSAPAIAVDKVSTYRLAPGDRIEVTVIGEKELSGDFPIDGAGNIVFPLVGSLQVGNLTLSECQQRISENLGRGFLNEPSVFVRVAELRQIQVLGGVKTPGSYPYRYGSIVKGAIAQAGGIGQSTLSEFLLADERVRVLEATRARLLVRKARLEAQRDGAKIFTAPAVPHDFGEAQFAQFVVDENEALSVETSAFEKQIELIRSKKPQFVAESAAIEGQISSEKKQLALVQKQVAAYNQLAKEGLSRLNSQVEVQLSEANKQSNIWRLEADRSRLNGTIVELDLRAQDIENAFKRRDLTDLEDVRQRLHEIEVTLPLSEQVRSLKLQQTGGPPGLSPSLEIEITRVRETEVTSFTATETTFLEPGDIIEVRVLRSMSEARSGLVENAPKISLKSR